MSSKVDPTIFNDSLLRLTFEQIKRELEQSESLIRNNIFGEGSPNSVEAEFVTQVYLDVTPPYGIYLAAAIGVNTIWVKIY